MTDYFLNVSNSLTGRKWIGPSADSDRLAEAIAQQTDLPDMLARVLAARGIDPAEAEAYLTPSLRDLMPNPSGFLDMDKAAKRLVAAVNNNEKIAIFADYDVDGGSSAALILAWLAALGKTATLYIPDRILEGYGPNEPAMKKLGTDHNLVICVDCGAVSIEPIHAANAAGADVIILDHHLGGEELPPALAVVNPNRQDESGDYHYLCAAAVVFLALVASNKLLREAGAAQPPLMPMLDLVALATVADVAPLIGFNRALVRQGLTVLAGRERPGLMALADVAKMNTAPKAYHLGYLLGPRLNAGGRVGQADLGARLLACTDPHQARDMAEKLDMLNVERREIEAAVQISAMEQAEERGVDGPLVWAAGAGWHPGVVGIVAARLKEKFNRPAIVIGVENGIGKGSGRSVSGIDLGAAVSTLKRNDVLLSGGGHKMAAGLSVAENRIDEAMAQLSEMLEKQGAATLGPADLRIDGMLGSGAATVDLLELLDKAGPFGASAPAPRFVIPSANITFAKRAGESHLRLTFDNGGGRLDAIAFRAFESDLGPALSAHSGATFHLAGRLEIDDWGGRRKVKLQLEDAAPAG